MSHMQALCEVSSSSMPAVHSVVASACAMLDAANLDPAGGGLSTSTDLDPFETLADCAGLGKLRRLMSVSSERYF